MPIRKKTVEKKPLTEKNASTALPILKSNLVIEYIKINELNPAIYNPRKWSSKAIKEVKDSLSKFGMVDPIICNSAESRKNIVIGGHLRLKVLKQLKYKEVPVVYRHIEDENIEKELNLRLNKNQGEFDYEMLLTFDKEMLANVGFTEFDIEKIDNINLGFNDAIKNISDIFAITFTFDKKDYDVIMNYIDKHTKPELTKRIVELINA